MKRVVKFHLFQICSKLFNGIEKFSKGKIKPHINKDVPPVTQRHRRVLFHLRKKFEDQLDKLLQEDIIEVAEGPTPWVSPIVIVPKPKDPESIRMCVDMRSANKAPERERHITPTMDEIIVKLNGAKIFSKLDLNQGYHQIEINEESRYITTFSTHKGLFGYKRLNFGIASAAEVF